MGYKCEAKYLGLPLSAKLDCNALLQETINSGDETHSAIQIPHVVDKNRAGTCNCGVNQPPKVGMSVHHMNNALLSATTAMETVLNLPPLHLMIKAEAKLGSQHISKMEIGQRILESGDTSI